MTFELLMALISLSCFAYAAYELVMEQREQATALARIPRPRRAS
ncbi:hypothetical protein GCM10010112_56040 [Actinoplanes lobatus]|uniref:Uncharacterized protein n=1 Tax=Actinoplanes lobatus TaxID=113568 RepID=A0A7W7MGC6_9ACTN|nr:hypothetical protein [Actinoplanes lobatus]MBB4749178.1 hypothetical protein [Actinoplanes lobatus]GGN80459.1 hypothetical protein GCM10010112_56040 [Actinoplanes lobatus]GIE45264.1 hypothetical protein Alo02nite_81620 [Actinoplanes lobatus]